jgi:hypothetical protein
MPRTWLSVSIGNGIRLGRSFSDAEFHARLPSFRRYELRHGLQKAAEARGETMTREDLDFLIDKALVLGLIDADGNGDLESLVAGTRDETIEAMIAAEVAQEARRPWLRHRRVVAIMLIWHG